MWFIFLIFIYIFFMKIFNCHVRRYGVGGGGGFHNNDSVRRYAWQFGYGRRPLFMLFQGITYNRLKIEQAGDCRH